VRALRRVLFVVLFGGLGLVLCLGSGGAARAAGLPDTPPAVGPPAALQVPVPQVLHLSDGTPVWLVSRPEVPLVRVVLSLRGGVLDAADPAALGLVSAGLAEGGGGGLDPRAWAEAVAATGAEIHLGVGMVRAWAEVEAVAGQEEAALDLARVALLDPALPGRVLRQAHRQALHAAREAWLSPGHLHEIAIQRTLYGPQHPLGRVLGVAALQSVSPARVRRAWRQLLAATAPAIVVVGDTRAEWILPVLERSLGDLPGAGRAILPVPELGPPVSGPRHVLVDMPGLRRSFLSVLLPVPGAFSAQAPAVDLVNRALAAEFDSRLSRVLREEHGWTYAVSGLLRLWPGHGVLELRCAVDAEHTAVAMQAIQAELDRLVVQPPAGEERAQAQAAVRRDAALDLLANGRLAHRLAVLQAWGQPPDAAQAELRRALDIDDAGLAEVIRRELPVDRALWVITGDRAVVEPQLDAAGLPLDAIRGGRSVVDGADPLPL